MELSKLQQEIIDAPYNKIVVLSSAASGKTKVMTEKVRQILRNNVDPKQIAVITFTNMAAAELKERLGDDYKPGLFVGTIHALANYFLLSAGIKTGEILDDEKFDELFPMVKRHPQCIKHLDWVLLDEAQDSDQLQFEFLFDMINPDCFFVCGDVKQSIYQWKGSEPELLLELTERPGVHTCHLNENYRNGSRILDYAKRIIRTTGEIDDSIPKRDITGTVQDISFDPYTIISQINTRPPYNQWAILCRTNSQIQQINFMLREAGIPYDTFRQGDLTKEELLNRMNKNTVKVLTIHSAKGLEWNNVVVIGARFYNDEEKNVCYVAATRARDHLIWIKNR